MSSPALRTYLDRLTGADVEAAPHLTALDHANRGGSSLRFLYGVLLDDPLGVLRSGSSTLKTWDFAHDDEIPADDVGRYVRDALDRLAYFKANAKQVAADAKSALAEARAAPGRER